MKNMICIIIGLILVLDANAADPNYDTATGIIFMPRGTVNNRDAYINIQLLLKPEGTYQFLAATPEQDAVIYAIGDPGPAGGVVFYISDGGRHGLEAAPEDLSSADWGCYNTIIAGADGFAVGTGKQNTFDILAGCTESEIAAELANNYRFGGYLDWFLPSLNELTLLYYQRGLVGNFTSENYWSSTEYSNFYAWIQNFGVGGQSTRTKNTMLRTRAIRAF